MGTIVLFRGLAGSLLTCMVAFMCVLGFGLHGCVGCETSPTVSGPTTYAVAEHSVPAEHTVVYSYANSDGLEIPDLLFGWSDAPTNTTEALLTLRSSLLL